MNTITLEQVFDCLPPRKREANKGDFGTLTVVGGCENYRGAAALTVLGALRSGVGIVRLASVEKVVAAAASRFSECTFLSLSADENGCIARENLPALLKVCAGSRAAVVGCGMGWFYSTTFLAEGLLAGLDCPLVLDADGLNAISDRPQVLLNARKTPVITPHPGEFARLTGRSVEEIQRNRAEAAADFAGKFGCVVLLKGADTVIASPDGRLWLNPTGNPGLAKGGSGDLLTGMIGAFLAQGLAAPDAACCGAYLHGLAADRCAERLSQYGMQPGDIVRDLCAIFLENGR